MEEAQTVTITQEEIVQIQKLQTEFQTNALALGQVTQNIQLIENDLNNLNLKKTQLITDFKQLLQQEDEISTLIKTKYGNGEIDLQAGVFIKK